MDGTDGGDGADDGRADSGGRKIPLDTLYGTLSHVSRRRVLEQLLGGDELAVVELVDRIGTAEAGKSAADVTEEERRRTETALRHQHLPRLVDDGFVEWGREGESVRLAVPASTVAPYLRPEGIPSGEGGGVGDDDPKESPIEKGSSGDDAESRSDGLLVGAGLLSMAAAVVVRSLPETTRARLASTCPLLLGAGLVAVGCTRLARRFAGDSRRRHE